MREAIELATIIDNQADLSATVVRTACLERLRDNPLRALIGQAALATAVAKIAEARISALLADPKLLRAAAERAEDGVPLTAAAVSVTPTALLRDAGLAAARL